MNVLTFLLQVSTKDTVSNTNYFTKDLIKNILPGLILVLISGILIPLVKWIYATGIEEKGKPKPISNLFDISEYETDILLTISFKRIIKRFIYKPKNILITAQSGYGKTTLAEQIAIKAFNKKKFDIIWWFTASKDSSLENDYRSLYKCLYENAEINIDIMDIIQAIKDYIKKNDKKCLFIYDSFVDDPKSYTTKFQIKDVKKYLINNLPFTKIIITSQNSNLLEYFSLNNFKKVSLNKWGFITFIYYLNKQNISLFYVISNIFVIYKLYNKFDVGRPIFARVISNLLKYEAKTLTLNSIIRQIKLTGEKITSDLGSDSLLNKSIIPLIISIASLKSSSKNLLLILSNYSSNEIPNFFIKEEVINIIYENSPLFTSSSLNNALDELSSKGLISKSQSQDSIDVHAMVMGSIYKISSNDTIFRKIFTMNDNIIHCKWALELLDHFMSSEQLKEPKGAILLKQMQLIPHCKKVLDYFHNEELHKDNKAYYRVSGALGALHHSLGQIDEADKYYTIYIDYYENLEKNETEQKEFFNIKKQKSYILMLKPGRTAKREALKIYDQLLQNNDNISVVIDIYSNKSTIYQRMGLYEKALNESRNIEYKKRADKENYIKTGWSQIWHDRASIYWYVGNLSQSLEFFTKAIESENASEDGKHLSKLIRGVVYGYLGYYTKQQADHEAAYNFFVTKPDRRRYIYLAYYLLSFKWDLAEAYASEREKDLKDKLFELVNDEKVILIQKIMKLRIAVRDKNHSGSLEAYENLIQMLEEMKDGPDENTLFYIDAGTFPQSAILDYAQFLKATDANKAKEVLIKANDGSNGTPYHREKELVSLAEELGVSLNRTNRIQTYYSRSFPL